MRRDLPACPPPSCRCSSPAPGLPERPAVAVRQLLGIGQLQGSGAARPPGEAWLAADLPVALPPPAEFYYQSRFFRPLECHGKCLDPLAGAQQSTHCDAWHGALRSHLHEERGGVQTCRSMRGTLDLLMYATRGWSRGSSPSISALA